MRYLYALGRHGHSFGPQMFFDFTHVGLEEDARELLDDYLEEVWQRAKGLNWEIQPTLFPAGRRILGNDRHLQAAVLLAGLASLVSYARFGCRDPVILAAPIGKLVSRIARRKLPLRNRESERIVALLANHVLLFTYTIPILGVLRAVRRYIDACGLTNDLELLLRRLQGAWEHDWRSNPLRRIQQRIAAMVGDTPTSEPRAEKHAVLQRHCGAATGRSNSASHVSVSGCGRGRGAFPGSSAGNSEVCQGRI